MKDHVALHREAMAAVDESIRWIREGRPGKAKRFLCRAKDLEVQAARSVGQGREPTRSVLFRSAATLAFDVGDLQEARSLAMEGIAGGPPKEIEDEMVALLAQIDDGTLGGASSHGG